ncbi:MAG: amidohydrolase family protein [Gemmatimonadota bacterium]|nr:amidohydrolase family protein [Gemmatimonadota bacterium]
MNYFDLNAWLGSWPFRALRDNTPETLIRRLGRAGIDKAAVSRIEAILHRSVQPANERLAEDLEGFTDRLIPMATINAADRNWEGDLRRCHEDLGMKGARLFPTYHEFAIDGPEARRVVSACAERGLPVFIPHRIEDVRQRHWMDPGRMLDLNGVTNLIASVSGATIVIPNARGIAGSALWRRNEIRDRDWYFDLSLAEVHYSLSRNVNQLGDLADFIDQGGADHLVFGTHAPFSYPSAARVKCAVLPVDDETLEAICYKRAERMLN